MRTNQHILENKLQHPDVCVQYLCTIHAYTWLRFSFPTEMRFGEKIDAAVDIRMQIQFPSHARRVPTNPAHKNKAECPGTALMTPAEGSAKPPLRLRRYLICRCSAGIVAALEALSTSMIHISSFYPSLCPMLFNFKVIAFPCGATKEFFYSPFSPLCRLFDCLLLSQTSIKTFIWNAKKEFSLQISGGAVPPHNRCPRGPQ